MNRFSPTLAANNAARMGHPNAVLKGRINNAGNRVQVSGNKTRGGSSGRQFIVTKLSKDYGACKGQP